MQLIDSTQHRRIDALAAADGDYRCGWERFEARMRTEYPARMVILKEKRIEHGAVTPDSGGFSGANFLRFMAVEASRLAFHHRHTGRAESAESALVLLGWLEAWPTWNAQARKNGWRSDLWTSDCAAAMGLALDQLADVVPDAVRRHLQGVLLERGVRPVLEEWVDPVRRIHALDSMGHNWWSVCVAGAAIGLFASADEESRAAEWFDLIAESIVEFFAYPGNILQNKQPTFGRQGDFIESVGYLDYTLHNLVFVFDLYRERLGRDLAAEISVLPEICDYYMACVQPLKEGVRRLNFGDMGSGRETVGAYNHNPSAVWLWLAGRFGRGDLFHLVQRTHPHPEDLFDFLFWPTGLDRSGFADEPSDTVFDTIGVAVLRDGYADDATVLAVKTGEKWNHNQSDAGSFILSARGVEFLIDPGTTEYSNPLHRSYFKSSRAHNVVLHDGRGQVDDLDDLGTKFMGRIASHLFAPGYKYVLADATGPWEGVYRRYYRSFLWIEDFVVMVDELMAWEPGEWTSLWHHAGEAAVDDEGFTVSNGGESLRVTFVDPLPVRVEVAQGHVSRMLPNELKYEYEVSGRPYLQAHYSARGVREKILTHFQLPGAKPRKLRRLRGEGFSGLALDGPEGSWQIILNHRADGSVMHLNSDLSVGDLETDAYLLAVCRRPDGSLVRAGLHNGSWLKEGRHVRHSSLLKGDAFMDFDPVSGGVWTHLAAPSWVMTGRGPAGDIRWKAPARPFHRRWSL
jgi:hypothetical protein